MKHQRLVLAAVGLALLGACANSPTPLAQGPAPAANSVTLRGHVRLGASAGVKAYGLLDAPPSPVVAPDEASVAKVEVFLTRTDVNAPDHTERNMGALGSLNEQIELRNLKLNATYLVRLAAENADAVAIDDNATNGASPLLGLSETEVVTTNIELQDNIDFRLKLKDVIFSGTAAGSVNVTPGQVLDNPSPEALATSTP